MRRIAALFAATGVFFSLTSWPAFAADEPTPAPTPAADRRSGKPAGASGAVPAVRRTPAPAATQKKQPSPAPTGASGQKNSSGSATSPKGSTSGATPQLALAARIADERLLPQGPAADARFGDFALRNDRILAVITAADRPPYLAQTGGLVADIALTDRRLDYFGFLSPMLARADNEPLRHETQAVEIASDGSAGRPAEVVARGKVSEIEGLEFETVYRLPPGAERLEIVTTWTNRGSATTPALNPIDWVHWGSLSLFLPNYGLTSVLSDEIVEAEGTWVSGLGQLDDSLAALYSEDRALKGRHQRNFSNIAFALRPGEKRELKPGESLSIARYLRPGTGDLAEASNAILAEQAFPTAEIYGRVFDTSPERKKVVGALVRVDQIKRGATASESRPRPYSQTRTNASGEFLFRVPPGEFAARGSDPTRVQPPRMVSQFLDPGGVIEKEMLMSPPYRFAFEVRDADTGELIPCKISISPSRYQLYPYMGPPWEAPYSRNAYYSVSGSGVIEAPKGAYQVAISRGPEYTVHNETLTFDRQHIAEPLRIEATLKRIVDTTGWVAVDIGPRTKNSWDCLVSEEDRVISAVAEGVELIIPTDYNVVTDLRDDINLLGLGDYIQAGLGFEIRDPKRQNAADFSVFPIDFAPAAQLQPKIDALVAETDPKQAFAAVRRDFPGALLQVNRPLDPDRGYFIRHGYQAKRGGLFYVEFDDSYSDNYDLIEVMRGRPTASQKLEDLLEPWHQLILSGDVTKRFGGGSASGGIHGDEVGYPRLYVKSSTDDPAKIDLREIAENIRKGAVILTSGPFLDFTVMDQGPGNWTKPGDDGFLYYDMKASAPAWLKVQAVSAEKEGHFFTRAYVMTPGDPIQYPPPNEGDRVRRIKTLRDWCAIMTAEGTETMEPVLARVSPDPLDAPVPLAVTGPIFFDEDADGKYTPPPPTRRHRN
jgi:hypothetical protein